MKTKLSLRRTRSRNQHVPSNFSLESNARSVPPISRLSSSLHHTAPYVRGNLFEAPGNVPTFGLLLSLTAVASLDLWAWPRAVSARKLPKNQTPGILFSILPVLLECCVYHYCEYQQMKTSINNTLTFPCFLIEYKGSSNTMKQRSRRSRLLRPWPCVWEAARRRTS